MFNPLFPDSLYLNDDVLYEDDAPIPDEEGYVPGQEDLEEGEGLLYSSDRDFDDMDCYEPDVLSYDSF